MTRRQELLLYFIILFGTVLRFYQIGVQSFWFDELVSVAISRLSLADALSVSAAIDPPLYYFLLHFWLDLGNNDGYIRMLSAIFSIASIPAVFVLGKRLIDVRVGLMAALIFAVAPIQLFYAQEARMYTLLVFFSTLSIWIYDRAQESRRTRDWAVWVVFTSLAIYSHIFASLLLVALDLDALWRMEKRTLRPVLIANAVIVASMIPWMLLLLPKFNYLLGILWLGSPTIMDLVLTFVYFVFGYTAALPLSAIALFIILAMLVFLTMSLLGAMRQPNCSKSEKLRLLLLCVLFPMLFTFLISQWHSMYLTRWFLGSSAAFYVLLAWGIVSSDRRSAIRVCAMASVPLVVIAAFNYFTVSEFQKPALREAIARVVSQRNPSEIIVHTSASSILAGRFYDPQGTHVLLYNPADLLLAPWLLDSLQIPYVTDPARLLSGHDSIWLFVILDHIVDKQLAEKEWFDRSATINDAEIVRGIGLYRYMVPLR